MRRTAENAAIFHTNAAARKSALAFVACFVVPVVSRPVRTRNVSFGTVAVWAGDRPTFTRCCTPSGPWLKMYSTICFAVRFGSDCGV